MEELIQTEESYIRDMEWVVEHYMPAMDDIASVPRNLVGKKNFIFSTIPQLLHLNKMYVGVGGGGATHSDQTHTTLESDNSTL